ncbi:MAG TPA: alpha/beta fold hydrolase [Verrucomicrobiae bacterium]|nr:alpha/beta fold hydrolase [Verrucomicrobiae bacterium]
MKHKKGLLAATGIVLILLGAALTLYSARGFTVRHYLVNAGSCPLTMDTVQKTGLTADPQRGAVVLFHGLAANKISMSYLARSFAAQGLSVYIPDLPGHGRSNGPFSPDQAESCASSFVRGLAARGLILPDHTMLVGHSMGGDIALRIAPKIRPAGVIAISPAPMQAAHGVSAENLLYLIPPPLQPNTLILVGQYEFPSLVGNAADLIASHPDPTIEFATIPGNSHLSVLFSPLVAARIQDWTARVLHLPSGAVIPSRANVLGCILGLCGIVLLAGPFLREAFGSEVPAEPRSTSLPSFPRLFLEFTGASLGVIFILRYWMPLRPLPLYQGNYLASFLLLVGLALLLLHPRLAQSQLSAKPLVLFSTAFSAFLLHFLVTGWFDLTFSFAWLTLHHWARFPVLFIAVFLFFYALEALLGPASDVRPARRLFLSLLLLTIAWLALAGGVLYLHSGEILLVLLAPYFVIALFLIRMGAQLVRRQTASPTAAALFGAILLAGFCLVLFPLS